MGMTNRAGGLALLKLRHHVLIFAVGFALMAVSGLFLVEGLSAFANGTVVKWALVASGILFQITEAICFMIAAIFTNTEHRKWRAALITGGCVLFVFSILVVSVAQKTVFQEGQLSAQNQDSRAKAVESEIHQLDNLVASYQHNADKQSSSIYAASRASGQDSLNRATELIAKREKLVGELGAIKAKRKIASDDIFSKLGPMVNIAPDNLEMSFIIVRAILLEGFGVLLMSLAAYLKSHAKPDAPIVDTPPENRREQSSRPVTAAKNSDTAIRKDRVGGDSVVTFFNAGKKQRKKPKNRQYSAQDIKAMGEKVQRLVVEGVVKKAGGRDSVKRILAEHCGITVGNAPAMKIVQFLKQKETNHSKSDQL